MTDPVVTTRRQWKRPPPSPTASGETLYYSSVGQGVNPYDVTFPIAADQVALVQYVGSDFLNAPEPAVSGDFTDFCFLSDIQEPSGDDPDPDHRRYSGSGNVEGDGTVTLSLDAMTGGNGGVINVWVGLRGTVQCRTGA